MRKLAELAALLLLASTTFAQSVNGIANQTVIGNSAFITGAGSANVMTGCPTPSITSQALAVGLVIHVRPNSANTTTTPTFNLCSLGAVTIVKGSGGALIALAAGDYTTGVDATFYYTGSFWELMNPQTGGSGIPYPGAGIPNSTGSAWGTSYTAQGTDAKVLTAGTIAGTAATLCTDANGGATTSGCSGGSGSLSLLAVVTSASAGSLDVTTRNQGGFSGAIFQSDFDDYLVEIVNTLNITNNVNMGLRVSTNGGSTFDSSATYTINSLVAGGGVGLENSASGTYIPLNYTPSTTVDNTQNIPMRSTLHFLDPAGTTYYKTIQGSASYYGGQVVQYLPHVIYRSLTAVNAFQVLALTGNIKGTVRVYGLVP